MTKIAVLITGQLNRNSKLFFKKNFCRKVKDFDLFISSYEEDISYIKMINQKKIKYLNIENYDLLKNKPINLRGKIKKNKDCLGIYQWYHLDKIISSNYNDLKKYDLIIKLRPDIYFKNISFLNKCEINNDAIYCYYDLLFYGTALHFLNVFSGFYKNICNKYVYSYNKYLEINYENLVKSDLTYPELLNLALPKFVINKNINKTKKIIRNNMQDLQEEVFDKNKVYFHSQKNKVLESEKALIYQIISKGSLQKCHVKCAKPRKFFNGFLFQYLPILDNLILFQKNLISKSNIKIENYY